MIKNIIMAFIIFYPQCISFAIANNADTNDRLNKGIFLFEKGHYERAVSIFSELIESDENNIPAYYWRARSRAFQGSGYNIDPDVIKKRKTLDSLNFELEKASKKYQTDECSRLGDQISIIFNELNLLSDEMHIDYRLKLNSDMQIAKNYKDRGRSLYWWWIYTDFDRMSKLKLDSLITEAKGDNLELNLLLALNAFNIDSFDLAIKYSNCVLNIDNNNPHAYIILVDSYYKSKNYSKSVEFSHKFFNLPNWDIRRYEYPIENTEKDVIIRQTVECFYALKDIPGVNSFLEKINKRHMVQNSSIRFDLGDLILKDDSTSLFRTNFFKAILEYQLKTSSLIREIATYHTENNQYDSALKYYDKLVVYEDDARKGRAEVHFNSGNYKQAIIDYTYIIERNVPIWVAFAHFYRGV